MAKYDIVGFDQNTGRISVLFDDLVEVSLDLPIDDNGNFPLGLQLDNFVNAARPTPLIDRATKLKNGVGNAAAIAAQVKPRPPQAGGPQ